MFILDLASFFHPTILWRGQIIHHKNWSDSQVYINNMLVEPERTITPACFSPQQYQLYTLGGHTGYFAKMKKKKTLVRGCSFTLGATPANFPLDRRIEQLTAACSNWKATKTLNHCIFSTFVQRAWLVHLGWVLTYLQAASKPPTLDAWALDSSWVLTDIYFGFFAKSWLSLHWHKNIYKRWASPLIIRTDCSVQFPATTNNWDLYLCTLEYLRSTNGSLLSSKQSVCFN
jgi:hypothetical protein